MHVHSGVGVLRHPIGIAVDADNNRVVVGDSGHHCVRGIDKTTGVVTKLAGGVDDDGFVDGPADLARFFHPYVAARVVAVYGLLSLAWGRFCLAGSLRRAA